MSRVLLTAGRFPVALDLARKFHLAGHSVVVADPFKVHGCKFSHSVHTSYTIPSPSLDCDRFVEALVDIVKRERIQLLVPCFEEALYIAAAIDRFPKSCEVFCSPFDLLHPLHNKWEFHQHLTGNGLDAPKTYLIEHAEQLNELPFTQSYALKATYSRASLNMYKVNPGEPPKNFAPSKQHPWIAQEWLKGKKFCTYTVCDHGKVLAHTTYPVQFAAGDRWCVTFCAIKHLAIRKWVASFAAATQYNGQVGFDFVQTDDGRLIALECNPRPTSGVHLFAPADPLANVIVQGVDTPLYPKEGTRRQIAIGFLAFGWRSPEARQCPTKYLRALLGVKDVVFSPRDPLPWLLQPIVFATYLKRAAKNKISIPALITQDLEWNSPCN